MTKIEFLALLEQSLGSLPPKEIEKTLAYYGESIDDRVEDGMDEAEAVAALGNMSDVVKNAMLTQSLPSLAKVKIHESRSNASNKTIWIVLAILGFPIWFSLLLAVGAVVFAMYITAWSLIVSLFAVLLSLAVAGGAGLIAGVAILFFDSFPGGLCAIGTALCSGALAVLLFRPVLAITKALIKFTAFLLRKIKGLFITTQKEVTAYEN